jgi:predicted enzyme related to lactoylglutathione lyase
MSEPNAQESPARIVAPVSRHLGTTDIARASAFWRDVLGFDVRSSNDGGLAEFVSGPARVRLGTTDSASDFSEEGPPGSAIVFFETDNVEGMRATIQQRGGRPTTLENVNRIKMRVFELRDPDGHAVWFGQSYQADSPEQVKPMVRKVMPELPHQDVPAGVRHYRDVLGFSINYAQDDIGVMDRDEARVLLISRTPAHNGIGSAYFYVRDADGLYTELLERGADLQSEPVSQPWGLREFSVLDLERNRLTFGQTFE